MAESTLPAAFNAPTPGVKYALKQVYRDPIARKAYVFFIDANTGGVLNSLDGYTLWEAGLGVGKPDGGAPAPAPAAPQAQENRFADPNTSPIRNDGFDNPQSGFNVDNLYSRRGSASSPAMGNTPTQNIRSQDFGNGVGRIIVEGEGSATPGTYNVNTPSQMGRVPSDIVSGTRQTDSVGQSFNPANPTAGYSFGPTPATGVNVADPGQLQGYFGKNANEVPKDVWAGYIAQEAAKRGINPEVAVAVARAEALNDLGYKTPNLQATSQLNYGRERSYGALQIHAGPRNNVHYADFKAATGFELDDPRVEVEMARIQYGLDLAARAKDWGDWRNTSQKLFGQPQARVGLENAKPLGISVTSEVVNAGFLGNTLGATPLNDLARESVGFGITQPSTASGTPGSGAPAIQSQSLMDLVGMSELQGRVANANYSLADVGQFSRNDMATPLSEEGAGYRAGTGFGPYDRLAPQERTFTPEIPSFSGTADFYGRERGTSRIGNNPVTGDDFAVARANEKATQDIFAQGPISERTLSGTSVANQSPATGQPPSGPIDYGNVGSGSVVFSAGSLQVDAKSGRITTQGPVSVVISNVLPDNAGFSLRDKNVNFVYDSKTNKGVVIPNDKASVHMATIANGMLAAKGKLDIDFAKQEGIRVATPSQIAWDVMTNANKYSDMILSQEETRKAMEEIGPKSYIDQVPQLEESSIEGLRAQAAQNQRMLAEMNVPNAAVDPSTGRVTVTVDAISPVRDPSLNWQGVPSTNTGILDYESVANYNPGFDKGYNKLAENRAINQATTFDYNIAPPTGGFGSYTGAGKARTEAEKVAAAFAATDYGIEMDSGMPGAVRSPSYDFASKGPNLSGISSGKSPSASFTSGNDYSGYDWSGGYTGRDARDSGRTAEFDSPTEGSRFGLKDGSAIAAQTRSIEANRQAEVARQASIQAQAAAQSAAQQAAAYGAPSAGYTGGGPTGGGSYSDGGSDRRGDSTTGWGGGSRDSSTGSYGGFSGGWSGGYNSGSANQGTGMGVGGVAGPSPSTGSGGSGSWGGPGPASGSGGFSSGSQGGYNGTDGGRR